MQVYLTYKKRNPLGPSRRPRVLGGSKGGGVGTHKACGLTSEYAAMAEKERGTCISLGLRVQEVQGCLAHKKQPLSRIL